MKRGKGFWVKGKGQERRNIFPFPLFLFPFPLPPAPCPMPYTLCPNPYILLK
ncbi:MAG: hypothetical protein KME31_10995 [Tolypothrix carrinoi HA7290-LM1]|nr:hypothetical protein [Tolypothrix carrinoi HA7290-LM1]